MKAPFSGFDRVVVPPLSPLLDPLYVEAAAGDSAALRFELRFAPIDGDGCSFAFPCDALGHVTLDALNERSRTNYLFARAVVGRVLTPPQVCCITQADATAH